MSAEDRRYSISEVAGLVGVSEQTLRRWERHFPQLKPGRNRGGRRYYLLPAVEIIRRIKHLVRHEGYTIEGARRQLTEELHGEGRPKTGAQALALLDQIEAEARWMLDQLDSAQLEGKQ